jgi:hypothetical protein
MQRKDVQVEAWEDRQIKKKKYTFRFLLQNIQWLPLSARESKHEDILNWMFTDEADAVILTEVNTYWPNVEPPQLNGTNGQKDVFHKARNIALPTTITDLLQER